MLAARLAPSRSSVKELRGPPNPTRKKNMCDNAWFVGYAPIHSAQIAAAVFVEHGGHGGESAAPIIHDMFQVFYDKNNKPGSPPLQISMRQERNN
jgi:cell division protein FtsI/penicillin-binding protein 2